MIKTSQQNQRSTPTVTPKVTIVAPSQPLQPQTQIYITVKMKTQVKIKINVKINTKHTQIRMENHISTKFPIHLHRSKKNHEEEEEKRNQMLIRSIFCNV